MSSKTIAIAMAASVAFAAIGAAIAADLKAKGEEHDKSTTTTTTDEHDKCWTKGMNGKMVEGPCPVKPKAVAPMEKEPAPGTDRKTDD